MAMDAQARTAAADRPAREDDYEALLAALSANARGRAFLAEFARRNRTADTEVVLAALKRLEERIAAQAADTAPADAERPRLAVVPPPDEPQLPIPSPAAQRPSIALAHSDAAANAAAAIPEVSWFGDAPADEPDAPVAAPVAAKPLPAVEPFAALMALTEEERIALFS